MPLHSITVPRYLWVLLSAAAAACIGGAWFLAQNAATIAFSQLDYKGDFAPLMVEATLANPAAAIASVVFIVLAVLAGIGARYTVRVDPGLAYQTAVAAYGAQSHLEQFHFRGELAVAR